MRRMGHLCSYHVYSKSYSYENFKNGSIFVFSDDGSKQVVTVWAKYLSAPLFSMVDILLMAAQNPIIHSIF